MNATTKRERAILRAAAREAHNRAASGPVKRTIVAPTRTVGMTPSLRAETVVTATGPGPRRTTALAGVKGQGEWRLSPYAPRGGWH